MSSTLDPVTQGDWSPPSVVGHSRGPTSRGDAGGGFATSIASDALARLSALQEITAALSAAATAKQIAAAIVDQGLRVLGARTGAVGTVASDGKTIELLESAGLSEEALDRCTVFQLSDPTPMSFVIRAGKPLFVGSPQSMVEQFPLMSDAGRLTASAWALLPLTVAGRTSGCLMFRFPVSRQFADEERRFLATLAGQCSQALERAQLFEDEKRLRAEAEEAQERGAFLADASRLLTSSLDVEATLNALSHLAVPRMSDWCSIHLVTQEGGIELVSVAHEDPDLVGVAKRISEMYPPDPSAVQGVAAVVRTGRAELYPDIDEAMVEAAARSPEHLDLLKRIGFHSLMIVPLPSRDRVIGALTMVSSDPRRTFDAQDLAFAGDLGVRAALAVDNARLYQKNLKVAQTLQRSLLPPTLPSIPGIEIAASYHPAGEGHEVGGDFYDIFSLGGRSWGIAIGDVCGKDSDAAALTALARYTIRAAAMQTRKPARILGQLNDAIIRQRSDGRFCTAIMAVLSPSVYGARLTLSCGGHPPALVLRANGTVSTFGESGMLLGLFESIELHDRATFLADGDLVLFYTDGCIEARRGSEFFGEDRLAALVAGCAGMNAAEVVKHVEAAILGFCGPTLADDLALLALKPTPS